jgi:DNA-binding MarR family transcriptional regulator
MANAPGAMPGRVVARLVRHIEAAVEPLGLSLPQYRLLAFLADGEAASSRLAETMAVSPPSVTSIVLGLEARGLIGRRPDPVDRRRQPLVLSAAGVDLLARANEAIDDRLGQILAHLDDRRATTARSAMGFWQVALDRFAEERRRTTQPTPT